MSFVSDTVAFFVVLLPVIMELFPCSFDQYEMCSVDFFSFEGAHLKKRIIICLSVCATKYVHMYMD